MAKHDMYAEKPHIGRDEEGNMKVKKEPKGADGGAEGEEKGVKEEDFDKNAQRHERLMMHHKHMSDMAHMHQKHELAHMHHKGDVAELHKGHEAEIKEMHARMETEHKSMHTKHQKAAGSVGSATVNTAAKKIDKEGVA